MQFLAEAIFISLSWNHQRDHELRPAVLDQLFMGYTIPISGLSAIIAIGLLSCEILFSTSRQPDATSTHWTVYDTNGTRSQLNAAMETFMD
jgi:hypothetical protein